MVLPVPFGSAEAAVMSCSPSPRKRPRRPLLLMPINAVAPKLFKAGGFLVDEVPMKLEKVPPIVGAACPVTATVCSAPPLPV